MPRPCTCDLDSHRTCWLYKYSPRHRAAWGDMTVEEAMRRIEAETGSAVPPEWLPRPAGTDCARRGEPTGETRPSPGCCGWPVGAPVPLLACSLHGACTVSALLQPKGDEAPVPCCRICKDRLPPAGA